MIETSAAAISARYQANLGTRVRSIRSFACAASVGLGESARIAFASRRAATTSPALYSFHAFFNRELEAVFGNCPFAMKPVYTGESRASSTVYTGDGETPFRSTRGAWCSGVAAVPRQASAGIRGQRPVHPRGGAAWRALGWPHLGATARCLGATPPYLGGRGTRRPTFSSQQPEAVRVSLPLPGW